MSYRWLLYVQYVLGFISLLTYYLLYLVVFLYILSYCLIYYERVPYVSLIYYLKDAYMYSSLSIGIYSCRYYLVSLHFTN